jgi:Glycosyltransferase family 87
LDTGVKKAARRSIECRYVGIILWCLAAAYLVLGLKSIDSSAAKDFKTYYAIAQLLSAGADPYAEDALKPFHLGVTRATDPPTFVLCIKPLAHVAFSYGYWIWTAVSAALLVVALISLSSHSNLRWAFLALGILYPPVLSNIVLGQSKIVILALLVLTMDFAEQEEHGPAGACLALATLLRIFPALLLGYFALKRRWRLLLWTVAWGAVGLALTFALLGPASIIGFLAALPALADPRWQTNENQFGLASVIYRNTNSYMLAAIGPAIILALTIKATRGKDDQWSLLSLWIVTALALLPVLWPYDLVILLIPFACVTRNAETISMLFAAVSYWVAGAQTWLYLFGQALLGARLTAFLYPITVKSQWLALVTAYLAAYWLARAVGNRQEDLEVAVCQNDSRQQVVGPVPEG